MVIWPKWAQLCPENHATRLTRTTTCSWKCCELPHSKKCQSYFSVPEWHSLEWGTAQRMIKYGDPDQMLLSHVPFSHLLFPAHVWPQDLYNNNNNNLKSMSIHASALPPVSPCISIPSPATGWICRSSGWERLILSSLRRNTSSSVLTCWFSSL